MGALVGAPLGAAVGSDHGRTGTGALVGGALGALTGYQIGAGLDDQAQARMAQAEAISKRLGVNEIISMNQSGLSEQVIINQIRSQGLRARPTTADLLAMKNAGVPESVVQAAQSLPMVPGYLNRMEPAGGPPLIIEEHYWGPGFHHHPFEYHHHGHRLAPVAPCPPRRRTRSSITFSHRF